MDGVYGGSIKLHWSDDLKDMFACRDALDWCQNQPSLEVAWKKCRRKDWMVWLIRSVCNDTYPSGCTSEIIYSINFFSDWSFQKYDTISMSKFRLLFPDPPIISKEFCIRCGRHTIILNNYGRCQKCQLKANQKKVRK